MLLSECVSLISCSSCICRMFCSGGLRPLQITLCFCCSTPRYGTHRLSAQEGWCVYSLSSHCLCDCCFQGTVANTASCVQLHKRAERVAVALMERGRLNAGDHVALVYPPGKREGDLYYCGLIKDFPLSGLNSSMSSYFAGIDLIATFYGCLYAGCVPVTVRPPHPQNLTTTLPTVKMIVEVT